MGAKITLGRDIDNGSIKHISEVENGLNCNCKCVECGENLIAVNNESNKREFHFRHEAESDCKGGVETALHLLAKQIIAENKKVRIDTHNYFKYSEFDLEVSLSDYQPDVIVKNVETNESWIIELAVTSFVDKDKLRKIKRDNLNCIEIDFCKVERAIQPNQLRELIIDELKIRKILNKKKVHTPEKKSIRDYFFLITGVLLLILSAKKFIRRR